MQDTIIREITVKASKERVYQAISDPKQITTWFPDTVDGTLEVGQRPVFEFTSENHKTSIYVEAATPNDYFAYRWVPGFPGMVGDVLTVPNTLVEFIIEESGDGTKITLKESGFATLAPEIAEESLKQNSGGWEHMMSRLEKELSQN
ncbi:MAG: SRPBCC family protein [bacterium]|nr:SRPBCC family protein [bacterium]